MAAKLLHSLADDNPDLQKQIGCMNGILQIFDRHHMGRRLNGNNTHKGILPPGNSEFSNASLDADSNNAYCQGTMERIGNKDTNDKRMRTEVSKTSFSLDKIIVSKTPVRDPVVTQSAASPKLGRLSLDLRDVVKDSMHRESKHKDSPRPLQLSKSFNERKNDLPSDLKESLKLLARLQEVPRYSIDGREMNHISNSNQRIEDLPRLSLDSRESSMRKASGYDLNLEYLSKDVENGDDWFIENSKKISRPPSVVAKLMGLETLPDNKPSIEDHVCRTIRHPSSPRSSRKAGDMRPISSSKCTIEHAPWKHLEGGRSPQRKVIKRLKSQERVSNSSPCVYREVEKKLKDMEFEQSGKDLRALKQILDGMEAKGLLGKEKEEKACKVSNRNYGYISASESHRKQAGVSKNQTSKEICRENAASSSTKRISSNTNLRVGQNSKKAQPVSRDSNLSSCKNSGSTSPRLQKKLELDKRSIPQSPDLGKSRRQSNRQVTESGGSPGVRRRVKSSQCQVPPTETLQCSDISETRTSSRNRVSEDEIVEELPAIGPEHPSPISVLDASAYGEDSPSPVKQTSHNLEGIGAKTSEGDHVEREWELADSLSANHDVESGFTPEIKNKESVNVDNLVEKLTVTQQNSNPVHIYVSEILSASGLLLSNFNSAFSTFQLHQSGQPINPELFFVLEQTKPRSFPSKSEKLNRKLIFDTVNDILGLKLAKKTLNAQKLLRELCDYIERLQTSGRREFGLLGEESDEWRRILWEDLMCRSDGWIEFCRDESGVVLDVERLIFKDLVDEVVIAEVAGLRGKPRKQCRKLFFK